MADAGEHRIPVLLGGQGGDEVLCGYQKYRYFYLWHLLKRGDPRVLREAMLGSYNGTRTNWTFTDASRYFPSPLRRRFSLVDRLGSAASLYFAGTEVPLAFDFTSTSVTPAGGSNSNALSGGSIENRQKADLTFASLPSLLHYEDRNSMAHSVESRLPFLDYRLVEFAVNCPLALKFRNGWNKWILRQALGDVLPDTIRFRKSKLGFDTPQVRWMRSGLSNGLRHVWDAKSLRMERFINPLKLSLETKRFLNRQPGAVAPYPLFRVLMLELWANVFDVL
jgi:asparagine synthase (glutamine-hydrolysing)